MFRLRDSKEGRSIRPIGHAVFKILASIRPAAAEGYVFPGTAEGNPFIGSRRYEGPLLGAQGSQMLRRTSCATVSQALPTIWASPKPRSPQCSGIREER